MIWILRHYKIILHEESLEYSKQNRFKTHIVGVLFFFLQMKFWFALFLFVDNTKAIKAFLILTKKMSISMNCIRRWIDPTLGTLKPHCCSIKVQEKLSIKETIQELQDHSNPSTYNKQPKLTHKRQSNSAGRIIQVIYTTSALWAIKSRM